MPSFLWDLCVLSPWSTLFLVCLLSLSAFHSGSKFPLSLHFLSHSHLQWVALFSAVPWHFSHSICFFCLLYNWLFTYWSFLLCWNLGQEPNRIHHHKPITNHTPSVSIWGDQTHEFIAHRLPSLYLNFIPQETAMLEDVIPKTPLSSDTLCPLFPDPMLSITAHVHTFWESTLHIMVIHIKLK